MKPDATPDALLFIDGYNIVGAWHDLKQIRDRTGLEEARRALIHHLTGYAAYNAFNTQLIFDAQYRDTPATEETITDFLTIHYTSPNETADTFIEKACANFRHDLRKFHQRLIVATSDRAQQLTVMGYGAEWMSAEQLWHEVDFTNTRVRSKQKNRAKPPGRFLMNSLDPEAQAKLDRLRFGK